MPLKAHASISNPSDENQEWVSSFAVAQDDTRMDFFTPSQEDKLGRSGRQVRPFRL